MSLSDELYELNLSYLFLLQRMLAEDRQTAVMRFHLTPEDADYITSLSMREIHRLCVSDKVQLRPNLKHHSQIQQILSNPKSNGLKKLHLGMLLASS